MIATREFKGPNVDEMIKFNNLVNKELSEEGKVAVYCRMGRGRTSTVVSFIMTKEGLGAEEVYQF